MTANHYIVRRIASAALLALALAGPRPARAAMPVIDSSAIAELVSQLHELEQQLATAQQTLTALAHGTNWGSVLPQMDAAGIQSPLPAQISSLQVLMSGRGNPGGLLGQLQALLQGQQSYNRVYQAPDDGSFQSVELNANADAIANAQAVAQQLYESNQTRIAELDDLQAQINDGTDDPSARESYLERLAVEQAKIQSQMVQTQALQLYASQQLASAQQRGEEHMMQSENATLCELAALGYWPTCEGGNQTQAVAGN